MKPNLSEHRSALATTAIIIAGFWFLPLRLGAQTAIDSTTYPPHRTYLHPLTITASYDPQYNKTVLKTEPFVLDSSISLSVLTALEGRTVTKSASSIVLTFWSTGPAGRYAPNHKIRVILNRSDTLDLGNAWLAPEHRPEYTEVLLKGSFLGQFLAIANASAVTFVVGPSALPLTHAQVEGLRDFASRMAPSH
jgi:hypothetical protein